MNAAFQETGGVSGAGSAIEQCEPNLADELWSAMQLDSSTPRPAEHGLALPSLAVPSRKSSMHYAVTSIDVWGRVADRSLLRVLGWHPGQTVAVSVRQEAIAVKPSTGGRHHLSRQGHLRVPAPVRHRAHLAAGDRLLLAACPDRDLLIAYPTYALDEMLAAYHAISGGRS